MNNTATKSILYGMRGIAAWITIPSMIIGLLCVVGGIGIGLYTNSERKGMELVSAEVIDASSSNVRVRYINRQGEPVEAVSRNSISPSPYRLGEKLDVFVDPNDPTRIGVDSFSETWLVPIFLSVFGLFFVFIPMTILVVFWKVTGIARQAMEQQTVANDLVKDVSPQSPVPPPPPPSSDNSGVSWK